MLAQANRTQLFWESHGSGRPMVLAHGGPGFDHTYFRPWLDLLGGTAQLIYYDQRGTGRSLRESHLNGITLATLADDLEALRIHLRLDRFTLFGHSIGGGLALSYARKYPDHLDGLILCATTPGVEHFAEAFQNVFARATPAQRLAITGMIAEPMPDDTALRNTLKMALPLYFTRFRPEYKKTLESMRCSAVAWNHLGALAHELNTCADGIALACPVLLVNGKDDWLTPPQQVERLREALPAATMVEFQSSSHLPFIEENKRFLSIVSDWLSAL